MSQNTIILGSQSPRRSELMKAAGLDFEVIPGNYVEIIEQHLLPAQVVLKLAMGKGIEIVNTHPDRTVVTADTIVVFDGVKMGKPKSKDELSTWLHKYSDQTVEIWTATIVFKDYQVHAQADMAQVHFDRLTEEDIQAYIEDPDADWMDKAGGFAIQGKAQAITHFDEKDFGIILGLNVDFIKKYII